MTKFSGIVIFTSAKTRPPSYKGWSELGEVQPYHQIASAGCQTSTPDPLFPEVSPTSHSLSYLTFQIIKCTYKKSIIHLLSKKKLSIQFQREICRYMLSCCQSLIELLASIQANNCFRLVSFSRCHCSVISSSARSYGAELSLDPTSTSCPIALQWLLVFSFRHLVKGKFHGGYARHRRALTMATDNAVVSVRPCYNYIYLLMVRTEPQSKQITSTKT